MKAKKRTPTVRAQAGATVRGRSTHARPVHKRVLLHPFTAFVLLCVGVLVIGSTFRSRAVSYDVTATVPAAALTAPAVITAPGEEQRFTADTVEVTGTCPASSYVKLYRDNTFSGAAVCSGGKFSVQTSLSLGANELKARVFNLTDQEGPASSPVTVYYDLPPPQDIASPSPPTTLQVELVDEGDYSSGTVQEASANPTISGLAPPFSDVTVTFYSEPSICKTKANAAGVWTCTLSHALPAGMHHVEIVAVTPAGKRLVFPTFQIAVKEYVEPFFIVSDYKYQAVQQGQSYSWALSLKGGTPPYQLVVDWGDGATSSFSQPDNSSFTISHAYNPQTSPEEVYTVLITALDARGATTVLQLTAVVKSTFTPASHNQTIFSGFMDGLGQWLWVVWPVYIVVVLMAVSFWIGEREAYQKFMLRRRLGRPHAGRR